MAEHRDPHTGDYLVPRQPVLKLNPPEIPYSHLAAILMYRRWAPKLKSITGETSPRLNSFEQAFGGNLASLERALDGPSIQGLKSAVESVLGIAKGIEVSDIRIASRGILMTSLCRKQSKIKVT